MSRNKEIKAPNPLGSLKIEREAIEEQRYKRIYRIWKEQVLITRLSLRDDSPSGAVLF